jgi:hypothetical protein
MALYIVVNEVLMHNILLIMCINAVSCTRKVMKI